MAENALCAEHPILAAPVWWLPQTPRTGPLTALFRVALAPREIEGTLWLSASQRFRLWINGELAHEGPPRAHREQWGVVAIPLRAGPGGLLAIEVTHGGETAGKGQTGGPAFLVLAAAARDGTVWTLPRPRGIVDRARCAYTSRPQPRRGHLAIGAGESFLSARHPWGWTLPDYDEASWLPAVEVGERFGNPWGNRPGGTMLVTSMLPRMAREPRRWQRVVALEGEAPTPEKSGGLAVAPESRVRFVLDAGFIGTFGLRVCWSGGAGSTIRLVSCECPLPTDGVKADRETVVGRDLPGQQDSIQPDGGTGRCWEPVWLRALRYLEVTLETGAEPLRLEGIELVETFFPLEETLRLRLEDPEGRDWERLRAVSRQTARASAHETFFDCPAWEQAQFPGDARLQARHHYLVGGEDRLARKAINDLAAEVAPCGLHYSHAPSSFRQVIATYSLQWIGMLYDLFHYRGQATFVRAHLPRARALLTWFLDRRREDGLLGRIDEPLFFDWAPAFTAGCVPQDNDGGSTAASALVAEACAWLATMETAVGWQELAPRWAAAADDLCRAIRERCWDDERQLLADTPRHTSFSVHAQVQAALGGVWEPEEGGAVVARALDDPAVIQPNTLYYRAWVAAALRKGGQAERVHDLFGHWWRMLAIPGLTTWPESDRNPRSDCHGWGLMPEIELVHTICGWQPTPAVAGWETAVLDPAPGRLTAVAAALAHPRG